MSKKILVVDDEPDALELIEFNLKQAGYEVATAMDGKTALNRARALQPALIVLDLMLPEMDGMEVCKALRGDPKTAAIPIIIVTAKEITAEDRERLNGKMAALYSKGAFTADQLLADISAALETMNGKMVREGQEVEVFHKTTL